MQSETLKTFTIATNEYRAGNNERTEYHPCVAWDRLAEITGQFLSKGQLVDIEGRLQTRQWDDDAGKRHWKAKSGSRSILAPPCMAAGSSASPTRWVPR